MVELEESERKKRAGGRCRRGGELRPRNLRPTPPAKGNKHSFLAFWAPSLFDPLPLRPLLTLGLILFPNWAGAAGAGHGAPGVTNACPRPAAAGATLSLDQEHVCPAADWTHGRGQGVAWALPPAGHTLMRPAFRHACRPVLPPTLTPLLLGLCL